MGDVDELFSLTYEQVEQLAKSNSFEVYHSALWGYFILSEPMDDEWGVIKLPDNPYGWQRGVAWMKNLRAEMWKDLPKE